MSRATCLLSLEKNVNTPSPASLLNNYLFFVIYIKNNGKSSIKIITCAPLSISLHLSLSGGEWFSSLSGFILAVTKHHLATYPPIQLTLSHIFLQRLHALNLASCMASSPSQAGSAVPEKTTLPLVNPVPLQLLMFHGGGHFGPPPNTPAAHYLGLLGTHHFLKR